MNLNHLWILNKTKSTLKKWRFATSKNIKMYNRLWRQFSKKRESWIVLSNVSLALLEWVYRQPSEVFALKGAKLIWVLIVGFKTNKTYYLRPILVLPHNCYFPHWLNKGKNNIFKPVRTNTCGKTSALMWKKEKKSIVTMFSVFLHWVLWILVVIFHGKFARQKEKSYRKVWKFCGI